MKWGKKPGCFKLTNAFCVFEKWDITNTFQPSYLSWGCGSYDKKIMEDEWPGVMIFGAKKKAVCVATVGTHLPPRETTLQNQNREAPKRQLHWFQQWVPIPRARVVPNIAVARTPGKTGALFVKCGPAQDLLWSLLIGWCQFRTSMNFETRNSLARADCFALGSHFALPAAPPTLEKGLEMIRRKGMPFTNFYTQTNKSEGHGGNMSIAPKANVRSGRATPYIRDKFISPLVGNP